eukprot:TRINITY_DN10501_c0_g1_i1.p3 TRINITY_DN10501_c0_g1~~TRINITY_DN10501_c0_g1_i1.p3  ORF type:complete len:50 (+),score=5.48 TRINITY_DN10501_c0_g1_i1:92-241(+)
MFQIESTGSGRGENSGRRTGKKKKQENVFLASGKLILASRNKQTSLRSV